MNDESDKSLKFEVDLKKLDETKPSLPKLEAVRKGPEARGNARLKKVTGKRPPGEQRMGLDQQNPPKRLSRRQMAEEMKAPEERGPKVYLPNPVPLVGRLIAFVLDVITVVGASVAAFWYLQDKLIEYHLLLMTGVAAPYIAYADVIYLAQAIIPSYLLVIWLPNFLLEGTIGKRLFNLRIKNKQFGRANFIQHIMREVFRPLSIVSVIGLLMGVMRPYRTLHDRLSGTVLERN